MKFWNNFADKHPAAAKWVREGGLFVIVSNLITVFKYLMLQFLPAAFAGLAFRSPSSARPSSGTSWATIRPTVALPTSAPTWWPWSSAR